MPKPQVTVFIDYQNAHHTAHGQWCAFGAPLHDCTIDPLKLAERAVGKRAPGGDIVAVRVYRGRPDPRKEQRLAAATDRQASVWQQDPRVTVVRRPLWYPPDWGSPGCVDRPREKGIDVSLAIDMVRMAMNGEFEVGILISRDEDLSPALELVFDLPGSHLEVATWEGVSRLRLRYRKLFCHMLDEDDFIASRDHRVY